MMRSVSRHGMVLLVFSLTATPPVAGHCPECGPTGISENEPNCGLDEAGGYDDFVNGGCGGFEPLFTPIAIGQTMCGTVAMNTLTGVRDTDWFELVLTQQIDLVWNFSAEFQAQIGVGATIRTRNHAEVIISLSWKHFSNANLYDDNDGIDFPIVLNFGIRF